MWINNYLEENEQQIYKKCCEFCSAEVPDSMARLFGCTRCNARYCSKEHKKADFRFHKMRCTNFNQNSQFPNTTNSFIADAYPQTSTLQQFQSDNNNFITTSFQNYQRDPSTQFSSTISNQHSPVQTNPQISISPQMVSLHSSQMQYAPSIATAQCTSPGNSREGFSYMPNPQPYQSSTNQYFSTENLSPMQATQAQLTPQGLQNCLISSTPTSQMVPGQMTDYTNTNDQITLEDALSFLDEKFADEYTISQQPQLSQLPQNSNPTTSPVTLVSTSESQGVVAAEDFSSQQREKQNLYDQLLLLDSNCSVSSQILPVQGDQDSKECRSSVQNASNIKPNEQLSQKAFSSLSTENDTFTDEEEISARLCEHFGLLEQSCDENLSLKEDGIFNRYDLRDVAQYIMKSLYKNNYCIVDYLHGEAFATDILEEVKNFHREEGFTEGRLSSSRGKERTSNKTVREDLVAWTDGKGRKAIKKHMSRMDLLLKFCNKLTTECEISSRTQAMVACYPGGGTGYKQHVDNPSKDGRCITTLYYLNPDWNVKDDGGILKLFPSGTDRKTVDVDPIFDRLLLFWSNRRTPHEVTPAFKIRYAITLWYFDEQERKDYIARYKEGKA